MAETTFESLPLEMLRYIISFLKGEDLWPLLAVSAKIRKVSNDNTLWKDVCNSEEVPSNYSFYSPPFRSRSMNAYNDEYDDSDEPLKKICIKAMMWQNWVLSPLAVLKNPFLRRKLWHLCTSKFTRNPPVFDSRDEILALCTNDPVRGGVEFFGRNKFTDVTIPSAHTVKCLALSNDYVAVATIPSCLVVYRLQNKQFERQYCFQYIHEDLYRIEVALWTRGNSSLHSIRMHIYNNYLFFVHLNRQSFFIVNLSTGVKKKIWTQNRFYRVHFNSDRFILIGDDRVNIYSTKAEPIWNIQNLNRKLKLSVSINESYIAVFHSEGPVELYNIVNGTLINSFNLTLNPCSPSALCLHETLPFFYLLLNENDDVKTGRIYAISTTNGSIKWIKPVPYAKNIRLLFNGCIFINLLDRKGWVLLNGTTGKEIKRGKDNITHLSKHFIVSVEDFHTGTDIFVCHRIEYFTPRENNNKVICLK